MTQTAAVGTASGISDERSGLRSLILYPIVLLALLGLLVLWLSRADLTETELVTLAPGPLLSATLEHLRLSAIATVIVLVIAIPLGILLTRGPMRRWTGVIMAIANIGQAAPAVGLIVLF